MFNKKPRVTKEERQKNMEQMIYDNWQYNRERGKFYFVMVYGVVGWGMLTYVFYMLITVVMNMMFKMQMPISWASSLLTLVVFAFAGVFYGLSQWKKNEKIFLKRYPYGRSK